jgi:hypothetical protein
MRVVGLAMLVGIVGAAWAQAPAYTPLPDQVPRVTPAPRPESTPTPGPSVAPIPAPAPAPMVRGRSPAPRSHRRRHPRCRADRGPNVVTGV